MNSQITESVLREVLGERFNQEAEWGQQDHGAYKWLGILGEEYGEVAKAINEIDPENYREECIQVAAVAVAMVEAYDRGTTFILGV